MADLFDNLGLKCEECGDSEEGAIQGYKVVEQRHLCKTCAERIAHAILGEASAGKIKWPCPEHDKKEVELYCRECQVPMCHTCAVTTHVRHELADILKFFAQKKKTIEQDLTKISDLKSENLCFLEMLTKCSKDIDEHFDALESKLLATITAELMDAEDKRKSEIETTHARAKEEIDKVIEKRDSLITDINENVNDVKSDLMKKNNAMSAELQDMKCRLQLKIAQARDTTNLSLKTIDAEESVAKSLLDDCDCKVFHERLQNLDKSTVAKTPSTDKDLPALLTSIAKKVSYKTEDGERNVGFLAGTKQSFEMEKTIKVPAEIKDPVLVCRVNRRTIAIRDGAGHGLYKVDVESGTIDPLMAADKNRGIFDVAFLGNDRFAYNDCKHGKIRIFSLDNKKVELCQDLLNDGFRFAYLTVDSRGLLVAADSVHGVFYVIDPTTATICRTINDIESRTILSFESIENEEIVIKSGHAEISWVCLLSGKIKRIISLEDWCRISNCHVGADNMIYVVYHDEKEPKVTKVGVISSDGTTRKPNLIEFPTSLLYRNLPRCVMPKPGTLVILNGNILLVYKETPGASEL
ncbi:uncharacterized protein [Diadema antillarum]|uniref:uncharacterized protein n=1 Tax=Diadema antillarum TaxID=105358 RepID=UPI003A8970F4